MVRVGCGPILILLQIWLEIFFGQKVNNICRMPRLRLSFHGQFRALIGGLVRRLYTVSQKTVPLLFFLNNFTKHEPILIIFGTQNLDTTLRQQL